MDHKELDAWKESMKLVKNIYKITELFPDSEKFGLTNQMRRASVSIPSNIAEGMARSSDKETIRFLNIASASCAELETQLIIAIELNFIGKNIDLLKNIETVKRIIIGLMKYLKRKK